MVKNFQGGGTLKMQKYDTLYCKKLFVKINELSGKMHIVDGLPSVVSIKNGIVLPRKLEREKGKVKCDSVKIPYQGLGGVVDSNGNFVKESIIYDLINTPYQEQNIAFGGSYNTDKIEFLDKTAIYLGLAHRHWGHFLIDIVQRCWYPLQKSLLSKQYGQLNSKQNYDNYIDGIVIPKDYIFVFAGFGDNSIEFKGNYLEFFRLLGLDIKRIVFVNQPTKFKNIVVPDITVYPGKYIYKVYQELFNIVCRNAMQEVKNIKQEQRIYFSRRHLNDIKDMGELGIENIMKKCNFVVLYPEELSLVEQIYYWQTAKEIACISGTISHNCVFASQDLSLYVFNKMKRLVGYQFTMDAVWGRTPVYIAAYKEPLKRYPLTVSRGPFWIDITEEVCIFVKDKFGIDVKKNRTPFDWIYYIILCGLIEMKYQFRGSKAWVKKMIREVIK